MDKEIKKWCKTWSIKEVVENIFGAGMAFMAREKAGNKEAADYKKMMVQELQRRINSKK